MAKSSSGGGSGNNDRPESGGQGADEGSDRIQQQIRDFASKAADLAQNPVARTMLAAGLVTAAAAMTTNKKVRDTARKAGREAADSAEDAAEAASRIGTAVVNAAADAFRRLINLGGDNDDAGGSGSSGQSASGGRSTLKRRSTRQAVTRRDRKSTRLNSSHQSVSRMPSSA